MNKERGMNVLGLTGNMGCGKSTIAELLQKHSDIRVLNCDQISKDLLFRGENTEKVKEILGDDVAKNGNVDGQKIAKKIFNDPSKKQELENFIHPLVWKKVAEEIQNEGQNKVFIVESALIFETNKDKDFDSVIVATCDQDEQYNRIRKRNAWPDEEIQERLKNQLPSELKETKGRVVINTNCSMKELETKIEKLYYFIKNNEPGKLLL